MFERLEEIEKRYEEIESEMATPEALANMEEYKKLAGTGKRKRANTRKPGNSSSRRTTRR